MPVSFTRHIRTATTSGVVALALLSGFSAQPTAAAELGRSAEPPPAEPAALPPRLAPPGAPGSAGATAPGSTPAQRPVGELLRDLRTLYAQAKSAATAYHRTSRKLRTQRERADGANSALAQARAGLARGRREAGQLARIQYRRGNTGIPFTMQLMLSHDPETLLASGHLFQRAADRQAATVRRLTSARLTRNALAGAAHEALRKQRQLTTRQQRQHSTLRTKLRGVEELLAALPDQQLTRMDDLLGTAGKRTGRAGASDVVQGLRAARSRSGVSRASRMSRASRAGAVRRRRLSARTQSRGANATHRERSVRRAPSAAGRKALAFAARQLGKPYRYGAAGPDAYDCSGLTSRAWRHAGRSIPRTSQAQWQQLRRVPLDRLRPGDLVVYYSGASHVALYAGRGKVIDAPHTGARVSVSGLRSKPVRGAVRPDSGAQPLDGYRRPGPLR